MIEQEKYTLQEAHAAFAQQLNGQVWQLLEQSERSRDDEEVMEYAAIASLFHWMQAGTAVHRQRGEWLIARVYTVLGQAGLALRHAQRCFERTEANPGLMEDFDRAYACEGLARALALSGDRPQARKYYELAKAAGEIIENAENKAIFTGDLAGGEWYGVV